VAHDAAWDLQAFAKETANGKAVVVDFYAKWCAPCLKMMPTVDKLASDFAGRVKVLKVEADGNQAVLPTVWDRQSAELFGFPKRQMVRKTSGFRELGAKLEL
jgi:thiol-disulfide isomerase/thioredoxin